MMEEKVKSIIAEQLGMDAAEISRDSHLIDDLGADSLDVVEIVMAFEEEFDTEIEDNEIEKIRTVGEIVDYINANQN